MWVAYACYGRRRPVPPPDARATYEYPTCETLDVLGTTGGPGCVG